MRCGLGSLIIFNYEFIVDTDSPIRPVSNTGDTSSLDIREM